ALGIARSQRDRLGQAQPVGDVSVELVVRAGLVGDDVGGDSSPHQLGKYLGAVALEADAESGLRRLGFFDPTQSLFEAFGRLHQVARLQAALDPVRVDLDAKHGGVAHDGGE